MRQPTEVEDNLLELARRASERAYVPYCDFEVGAAVEFDGEHIVTGVDVDNSSYPLGACAERGAVSTGVGEGHRRITAIAVWGKHGSVSPCGGCRQILSEFVTDDCQVTFRWQDERVTVAFDELLPFRFRLEAKATE